MFNNKKAIDILKKYDVFEPESMSTEDFNYAKDAGIMFDDEIQKHDDCVSLLFEEYKKTSKRKITNAFLASFSKKLPVLRAGLPVVALMHSFPFHKYEGFDENPDVCKFCASSYEEKVDFNFINQCRFAVGGLIALDIYEYSFYLQQANLLEEYVPNEEDLQIFKDIIYVILNSKETDTPNILKKSISKVSGFKSKDEERKALLETLGYCSILENQSHKGFLSQHTILGLAPLKNSRSDWRYPIDWWTGRDGINKEAFTYWFGEYEILRDIF